MKKPALPDWRLEVMSSPNHGTFAAMLRAAESRDHRRRARLAGVAAVFAVAGILGGAAGVAGAHEAHRAQTARLFDAHVDSLNRGDDR